MCLCACGNYKETRTCMLRRGQILSCGCYRAERLIERGKELAAAWAARRDRDYAVGRAFGRLVVASSEDQKNASVVRRLCRCECGTYKFIPTKNLRNGMTKSCGCLNTDNNRAKLSSYRASKNGSE